MSWPKVRLGDVCEFRRGLTYSKGDEVEVSSNVVLRSNNVDLDTGLMVYDELKYISNDFEIPDDKRVVADSVLMCMANGSKAHLGKVGYIEKDLGYAFGGFMGLLVPKGVVGKYLYWVLSSASFKKLIQGLTAGANINNLRFAAIKDFEIPLPPLAEQKKIVEKVEKALKRVDALKAQFERMEKSAADYFKAALAETFAAVKGEKVKLGDVCNIVTGKKDVNQGNPIGRYPFFTCAKTPTRADTYSFDCEALLIAGNGDVGHVQKYSGKFEVYQRTYVLSGFERAVRDYVYYQLNAYFKDWAQKNRMGNTMPYIKMGVLSGFEFSVPDESVQYSIVATLDAAKSKSERMVAAARRGIEICGKMHKAILAEAFQ